MTDTITYIDGSSQIASITSSAAQCSISFLYTYDDNGNILTVSDGTNTTRYQYDSQNQLIREDNQAYGFTYVWTYDNAGNIRSRVEFAYTTAQTPGNPGKVVSYQYSNGDWGDLLTGRTQMANGVTSTVSSYTYDEIGNPLSDGTWTYTWKHGRELASMTNGSTTWAYTYDANGMRTKRTNGSTTYEYIYTGSQLKKLKVGSNTLLFQYGTTGMPVGLTYNNTRYYYVTNLQGDVIAILNSNKVAVVTYTYDAWGNILTTTDTSGIGLASKNPLRYRGYVYDQETGLYYLQSRYYNPAMGRFINADALVSTGQGILGYNMFAYCLNNPVNLIDPRGSIPFADDPYAETYQRIGEMIGNWLSEIIRTDENERDANGELTLNAKLKRTGQSFYRNLEVSGGIGLGLYGEKTIFDLIGLSGGLYYNLFNLSLAEGEWTIGTEFQTGANINFFFMNLGYIEGASGPYGTNPQFTVLEEGFYGDETWTIYSVACYPLAGGSFRIGFDIVQFVRDLDEIYR